MIVDWRCRIPSLRLLVSNHSWTRTNTNSSRPLAFSRSLPCQPEASSFQSWKNDNNVKSPTGTLNPEATNENWPNEVLPDAKSIQPQAISCNCLPELNVKNRVPNLCSFDSANQQSAIIALFCSKAITISRKANHLYSYASRLRVVIHHKTTKMHIHNFRVITRLETHAASFSRR